MAHPNDFSFPELSPEIIKSAQKTSKKGFKLSKEEQQEANEVLACAIEQKSLDAVKEAIENGALPKTSTKVRDMRLTSFALKNFQEDIMEFLMTQKGFRLGYFDTLVREVSEDGNIDAFHWLCKNEQMGLYAQKASLDGALKSNNPDMIEASLRYARTQGQPFTVNRVDPGNQTYLREIPAYYSHWLFTIILENKHEGLLNEVLKIRGMDKPAPQNYQTSFFAHSFLNVFRKAGYEDARWWQEKLHSNKEFGKMWEKNMPLKIVIPRTWSDTDHNTLSLYSFVDVLVAQGSRATEGMSLTSQGRKALLKSFDTPALLHLYLSRAPRSTSLAVLEKMSSDMKDWKDKDGNNLGHFLLLDSASKSMAMEIYSWNKDWLAQENNDGKTPLDFLPQKISSAISNKLLRKNLNDAKLGLVHNRTKSTRKM